MVRAILLGTAVTAAALVSTPSASAQPICVQVQVQRPAALNTGHHCTDLYPLGTGCATQGAALGTIVSATMYSCLPMVLIVPAG